MADLAHALQSDLANDQNEAKRKRDENGTQIRAKRARYTSIACNECKRRKIKCNGETPCQRCGNLNLECLYAPNCCSSTFKDSNEFKEMNEHIQSLQNQVDALVQNLTALRGALGQDVFSQEALYYNSEQTRSLSAPQAPMIIDPALQSRGRPSPKQARFQGPTSSEFSLGLARSSLRTMGITGPDDPMDEGLTTQEVSRGASPTAKPTPLHSDKDPIWALSKDEALRLCHVYNDEMGHLYPILNIEQVLRHATLLFTFVEAVTRNLFVSSMPGVDAIQDEETDVLRIILAIAMVTEGTGRSDLGKKLVKSVSATADNRLLGNVTLKDIQILTLIAMYHFHTNDESLSWRVIGLAARLCIELGLHRSETYEKMFSNEDERMAAIKLFWSIYTLDRRWSFGTGMSFALQDSDIDPRLPKPNDASPYLNAMITYCNIAAKVWKAIASTDSASTSHNLFSKDEISYLDYQVLQWQRSIPESLRFFHPSSAEYTQSNSDPNMTGGLVLYRQRLVLYLRANQMRISIYRPFLYSPNLIASTASVQFAQTVTDVAKDTIRVLTHVNRTSNIYRTQQITFNYFLLSALAVLFLAVSHAPAEFSASCREEFYMALDLIRTLSANSYASRRLWRMIRGMKEVAPRLGLYSDNSVDAGEDGSSRNAMEAKISDSQQVHHDAHSSAAVAMAGLAAGHPIDESIFYANSGYAISGATNTKGGSDFLDLRSPNGMVNELTTLFEAAGGYGNNGSGGVGFGTGLSREATGIVGDGTDPNTAALVESGGVPSLPGTSWGNEEELTRIMRDLF